MGGHRVLLAGESHIEEVLLLPKLSELPTEVRVVIFPCETKFLILHVKLNNCSILKKSEREMTSKVLRLTVSRRMLVEGGQAGQAQGLDNLPGQDDELSCSLRAGHDLQLRVCPGKFAPQTVSRLGQ